MGIYSVALQIGDSDDWMPESLKLEDTDETTTLETLLAEYRTRGRPPAANSS